MPDRIYLSDEAQKELEEMYADKDSKIEIEEDPYVRGVYAVQVTNTNGYSFQLLWTNDGTRQFDEVEFESWPPHADPNDLKFL